MAASHVAATFTVTSPDLESYLDVVAYATMLVNSGQGYAIESQSEETFTVVATWAIDFPFPPRTQ